MSAIGRPEFHQVNGHVVYTDEPGRYAQVRLNRYKSVRLRDAGSNLAMSFFLLSSQMLCVLRLTELH
jgi:hypothetical protein